MKVAFLNEEQNRWEAYVAVNEWYSVSDVSIILSMGGPQVYQAIQRGTIKAYKVNGTTMVRHEDLQAYITRRGASPVFDPSQLQIEEIVPRKIAEAAAEDFTEDELPEEELDFLDT